MHQPWRQADPILKPNLRDGSCRRGTVCGVTSRISTLPKILVPTQNTLVRADAARLLSRIPDQSVQLVYVDPPFNTGKVQSRAAARTTASATGSRRGFHGKLYDEALGKRLSYEDTYDDYLGFLMPLLADARERLTATGTLYVHLDYREVHYVKVALDSLFGRSNFLNEIIWAYDYGAKTNRRWPTKHDTILVYAKDSKSYYFSNEDVDREPYMAPGLVTPEKQARGKLPTDVWWHTIVSPTGNEKTGYPTQKPEGVLRRIVTASSRPGDTVLDFFGGSGTTAAVAGQLDRRFITGDNNLEAVRVMRKRLAVYGPTEYR